MSKDAPARPVPLPEDLKPFEFGLLYADRQDLREGRHAVVYQRLLKRTRRSRTIIAAVSISWCLQMLGGLSGAPTPWWGYGSLALVVAGSAFYAFFLIPAQTRLIKALEAHGAQAEGRDRADVVVYAAAIALIGISLVPVLARSWF